MILNRVEKTLKACGVERKQPVLVALSGGADSMTLLHVLMQLGQKCQAAHCNFHLRDNESDEDEGFVFDFCLGSDMPLHVKHFDTYKEAKERGVSVEMAARDLRYEWFWNLVENQGFHWLATGHHGDDMIETFFLNLARGSGLRGLKGMKHQNGRLIRPLLSFKREEIESYCHENGIPFRVDSTNIDTAFQRNNIRHNVLPVMNMLNPSFFNTMMQNFRNLGEVWQIFEREVSSIKEGIVAEEDDLMLIPLKLIKDHPQRMSVLFEILRPYGFNSQLVSGVVESLDGIPGKQFFSKTHRLVRDRFNLVLMEIEEQPEEHYFIQSGEERIVEPLVMSIKYFERDETFQFSRDCGCVHLDADLVDFPLLLRHWRSGDQFRPLGMEQFKKLSDFFIDQKFSILQKEKTWLLFSGDDVMWVVGWRIDDRYKVTPSTKNIIELSI
jgi:tRNA(Ile)-lysidine synthase